MTLAFSYQRFSSEKQKHGGSLDRQGDLALEYAHKHGLVLDNSTYRDLGVSAFRSKNLEGKLGAFIEAVEAGRIPRGSYFLVEALDRLSRDTINKATALLLRIINNGIVVVTLLRGERILSETTLTEHPTLLLEACMAMMLANEESANKSKRAHAAIKRRTDRGELATTRLPTWLKFSDDRRSATFIPDRTKVIQRIFDAAINGDGAREIARTLNAEKVPVLFYAQEWRQSAVSQLLRNPAAYGHFKKQDDALPAAITKERWLKAQQVIDARRLYHGMATSPNPNNIFAGFSRCAHCGRAMRYQPRTVGLKYMMCVGGKQCVGRLFPFEACEEALIYELAHRSQHHVGATYFSEQISKRSQLELEIEQNVKRQRKLLEVLENTDAKVVAAEINRLQEHIDALERELKDLSPFPLDKRELHENVALFDAYTKLGDDKVEYRKKLKVILGKTIKKIEFYNGKTGWKPQLLLTYVSDVRSVVDVTRHLPQRTQVQLSHGINHRSDLGKVKR